MTTKQSPRVPTDRPATRERTALHPAIAPGALALGWLLALGCGARTELLDPSPGSGATPGPGAAGASGGAGAAGQPAQAADRVEQLAAGYHFTCARYASGRVSCWGFNGGGQLGDGSDTTRAEPKDVPGVTGATFLATSDHGVCVVREGGLLCWGNVPSPTGNDKTPSPTPVSGISNAVQVASSGGHGCFLDSGGEVRCWGHGEQGQLGGGSAVEFSAMPVKVPGMSGAEQVATGEQFSCALRQGEVWCWGSNDRLRAGGLGTEKTLLAPTKVRGLEKAIDLKLGLTHGCVASATGEALCWGENLEGCLGYPAPSCCADVAKAAEGVTLAIAVGATYSHSCALLSDRRALCWGLNSFGQLGSDAPDNSPPVQVQALTDAVQIAAGSYHNCALRSSGAVVCWGANTQKALGPKAKGKASSLPIEVLPPG